MGGELAGRPALLVDVLGLKDLLQETDLVVGVEDGEVALQTDQLGVAAQDLDPDRVEGAEPGHPLDRFADQRADALAHLAGGLVGEGDGEDLAGPRLAGGKNVGDACGQHPRLAGPRPGEHQHRSVQGLDRLALLRVESGKVARSGRRACPRRDAAGGGRGQVVAAFGAGIGHDRQGVNR